LKRWCLKESKVKATGMGLLKGIQHMREGFEPLLWSRSLRVPSGFIAAASIAGGAAPKPENLKFIQEDGRALPSDSVSR
jgi:hypothetical protein